MLSHSTLALLHELLCSVQLHVGRDDFEATARAVVAAKAELEAALADTAEVIDLSE